ncbi:hypothetical protein ACFYYL_43000 [Actinomadura geliboluensis]|uniref:hypothetical protein n=1 Tax=Actinomadura geliboluensis TaxID=882440 RepID=UPI0036979AF6
MTISLDELQRLAPDDVVRYLNSTGWRRAGDLNGRATVWEFGRRNFEVIVPVSDRFRDFPQRMYEVVQTLAEVEERPEPEVLHRLTTPNMDRQYFRLFPDAPPGLIPAADAAEAFQGVRELFIAAAYAEYHPRAGFVLPNSKPRVVREFPEKALLGTAPGSFVISAEVPLGPSDDTLFSTVDAFERRVLLRLRRALFSARAAAEEASERAELTPFEERTDAGVSRTLCQALARLGGSDRNRPFEIQFDWASTVATKAPNAPVRFEGDQVGMLAHAAEDLGRRPRTEPAQIRGRVRAMDRDHPEEQGWVVIRGLLTTKGASRNRQVWVPLSPDDYDRALRAHGQGLEVRVSGSLTRTGRRAELRPDGYFRVL